MSRNNYKQPLDSVITEWILKIAIVIFVFKILYSSKDTSFFDTQFIDGFLGILKFIVFLAITVVLLVLRKDLFKIVGFLMIFMGSFYYSLVIVTDNPVTFKLAEYLLLMAISLYYLIRVTRIKKKD